jgi:hypothetical protein
MQFQDLTGQVFNKLTILSYQGKGKNGQSKWLCKCECGNEKIIFAHHMKSNNVKSCGCALLSENRKDCATRFGGTGTPEWTSFHSAKKRCKSEQAERYPDHAGRGIQFKFENFKEFLDHIGPRPEPKFAYSLDRIDNDGHYEIGNVRWSTKKQQARNRRCDNCEKLRQELDELKMQIAKFQENTECLNLITLDQATLPTFQHQDHQ